MKKIIITILVGLFSCQTPVVNKDKDKNTTTTKDNNKPDFSGKDCIPYDLGNPPLEKLTPRVSPEILRYMEKSTVKKENPYLGKIEMFINEEVLPNVSSEKIEINKSNKIKIEELEKNYKRVRNGIKINDKDTFYFEGVYLDIIFSNSCEYDFFKSKTNILNLEDKIYSNFYKYFTFEMDLSKEKIEIEKIEPLLHEYNKNFINDITKIEFSSPDSLKIFLLFIKLRTQEPIFYRDLQISIVSGFHIPT